MSIAPGFDAEVGNDRGRYHAILALHGASKATETVELGQRLAANMNDEDVSAFVRKVESVVVGLAGVGRLSAALAVRAQARNGHDARQIEGDRITFVFNVNSRGE